MTKIISISNHGDKVKEIVEKREAILPIGPKVEKLSPAATFSGSALPFQLYRCLMMKPSNWVFLTIPAKR